MAEQGFSVANAALYHNTLRAGSRQRKRLLARDFLQELSRGRNKEVGGAKVRRHRRPVPQRIVFDIEVVLQPHARAGRGCSIAATQHTSAHRPVHALREAAGGGTEREGGVSTCQHCASIERRAHCGEKLHSGRAERREQAVRKPAQKNLGRLNVVYIRVLKHNLLNLRIGCREYKGQHEVRKCAAG